MNANKHPIHMNAGAELALDQFLKNIFTSSSKIAKPEINKIYMDALGIDDDVYWSNGVLRNLKKNDHSKTEVKKFLVSNGVGEFFNEEDIDFKEYLTLDERGQFTVAFLSSLVHEYLADIQEDVTGFFESSSGEFDEKYSAARQSFVVKFLSDFLGNVELYPYKTQYIERNESTFVGDSKLIWVSQILSIGLTSGKLDAEKTMCERMSSWLLSDDVGASSSAMASVTLGEVNERSYPHDLSDFNRCLKLIKAVPEVRDSFDLIAKLSPTWEKLIKNWDELEELYLGEIGIDNEHNHPQRFKSLSYKKLKQIIATN